MFDKKTLPLIILLAILIFAWFPLLQWLGIYTPAPPKTEQPTTAQQDTTEVAQQPAPETTATKPAAPVDTTLEPPKTAKALLEQLADTVAVDTIEIKTNKYTVMLSNDGGGPLSLLLSQYHYRDSTDIQMLPHAERATPDAVFAGGTLSSSTLRYHSSLRAGEYDATRDTIDLEYRYNDPSSDGAIIKRYRFYPNEYHYDFTLEIHQPSEMGLERSYQMMWNTPLGVTEPQAETDYRAMEVVAMMSGSRETLDDYKDNQLNQSLQGYTDWAGVRSRYFAAVLIPRGREGDAAIGKGFKRKVTLPDGDKVEQRELIGGIEMSFANVVSFADSFTVFVGPLDYNLMSEYHVGLQDMLGIGTTPFVGWLIKPFAIAVMWLLPRMYDVIPNYGLVIILFALLVKIVTMPLSMKSFKSMNAMRELQPKMEELKQKYKKDPQALQRETMKLYKQHGVNPVSGCLPMLPQMPLFFAMFSVFRSTILLRNAPFFWYFDDLSRGASGFTDPYIALVIVMIVAQFVSQRLTMPSTQQNKSLMMLMPVFMGFLFYRLSAGLILYWTSFSAFSLLDWLAFKRKAMGTPQPAGVAGTSAQVIEEATPKPNPNPRPSRRNRKSRKK